MNQSILISGNTYPVKDALRALGGRWNARLKGWMVPPERAEEARKLVESAPKQTQPTQTRTAQARTRYRMSRAEREDLECELCGKNKFKCGHCIGW